MRAAMLDAVIPANAGTQRLGFDIKTLDPGVRRGDGFFATAGVERNGRNRHIASTQ
jgi:hypothetical protein